MTYLVLARKWRPQSFETLVGQEHVVRALTTALSTQRLHHAWLFTGTRGVGKTTLSRILAKALNCEQGITPTPCGTCAACTGIEADRFVDYVELDAASNRGVDEMTRLLEQAVYAPTVGRFKVYMIDEVHMLTGHAFNAMLKTLEEPPPHVKFILATTDPQKIPVTVLSRCLQFNLKQMPPEAIVGHLTQVLEAEQVAAEPSALRLIGVAARGSMRDALSLTDQAIAYSGGNITEEAVRSMLGTVDQRYLIRLLDALAAGDGVGMIAIADELSVRSLSYSEALGDLAGLLAQVAMAQRIPGLPSDETPMADEIRRLAHAFSADAVQLFYSIALHSRNELALAPDEYAGFVMACLRMLAFSEADAGATPASSGNNSGNKSAASGKAAVEAKQGVSTTQRSRDMGAATRDAGQVPTSADASFPAQGAQFSSRSAAEVPGGPGVSDSQPEALIQGSGRGATPPAGPARMPAMQEAGPSSMTLKAGLSTAGDKRESSPSVADDIPPWLDAPESHANDGMQSETGRAVSSTWQERAAPPRPNRGAAAPTARAADTSAPVAESTKALGSEAAAAGAAYKTQPSAQARERSAPLASNALESAASVNAEPRAMKKSGVSHTPPLPHEPSPAASQGVHRGLETFRAEDWPALAMQLPLSGMAAQLAECAEWVGVEDDTIILKVEARSLATVPAIERVRGALANHFGQALRVRIEQGKTGAATAQAVKQAEEAARQRQAEEAIANDPFVQTLLSEFGGELIPGSVKPVLGSSKPGGSSASATWYDTVSSPVIHTKRTHS